MKFKNNIRNGLYRPTCRLSICDSSFDALFSCFFFCKKIRLFRKETQPQFFPSFYLFINTHREEDTLQGKHFKHNRSISLCKEGNFLSYAIVVTYFAILQRSSTKTHTLNRKKTDFFIIFQNVNYCDTILYMLYINGVNLFFLLFAHSFRINHFCE